MWGCRPLTAFSGGIEKEELALKVLPYLDPRNIFVDDEPYPLASNCMIQFVLRFLFLGSALVATHAAFGASAFVNFVLFVSDGRYEYHKNAGRRGPRAHRPQPPNTRAQARQNAQARVIESWPEKWEG